MGWHGCRSGRELLAELAPPERRGNEDAALDAIAGVLPPLLTVLEALDWVARNLHPPDVPALAEAVASLGPPFEDARERFRGVAFPPRAAQLKACIAESAKYAGRALDGITEAAGEERGRAAYRAMGQRIRAVAALYPLAPALAPVNRYFVDRERRGDEALLAKLAAADGGRDNVGVLHHGNGRDQRGGWSLYVPENYDESKSCPLVCALHGGSGHGRDFLWTWLASVRTRGALLLSPTALGRTWSLDAPEADVANIHAMLDVVDQRWHLDRSRLLLTGMSDGGTFCYLAGLGAGSPFTHLAPGSASFSPFLLEMGDRARIEGLPIYLVHGTRDWMFPVDVARAANAALSAAGATVRYREIADLSHVWAREENARILEWLDGSASPIPE